MQTPAPEPIGEAMRFFHPNAGPLPIQQRVSKTAQNTNGGFQRGRTPVNNILEIICNPEAVAKIPREQIPALLLEISSFQGALAANLLNEAEPAHTHGNGDKLLEVKEAAAKLAVTEDWLYRKGSKLPFVVRIGRNIRFSERGIENFIKQRTRC
jgi:predicted DNA-binding transcriptional regulator AlpA